VRKPACQRYHPADLGTEGMKGRGEKREAMHVSRGRSKTMSIAKVAKRSRLKTGKGKSHEDTPRGEQTQDDPSGRP